MRRSRGNGPRGLRRKRLVGAVGGRGRIVKGGTGLYPQGIEADEAEAESLAVEEGVLCVGCGLLGLEVAVGFLENGGVEEDFVVGSHGGVK